MDISDIEGRGKTSSRAPYISEIKKLKEKYDKIKLTNKTAVKEYTRELDACKQRINSLIDNNTDLQHKISTLKDDFLVEKEKLKIQYDGHLSRMKDTLQKTFNETRDQQIQKLEKLLEQEKMQKQFDIERVVLETKHTITMLEKTTRDYENKIEDSNKLIKKEKESYESIINQLQHSFEMYKIQESQKIMSIEKNHDNSIQMMEDQYKENLQKKANDYNIMLTDAKISFEKDKREDERKNAKIIEKIKSDNESVKENMRKEYVKREEELKEMFQNKFMFYVNEAEGKINLLLKKNKEDEEKLARENGSLRDRIDLLENENSHIKSMNDRMKKSTDDINKQYSENLNKQMEANKYINEQKDGQIRSIEYENLRLKRDLEQKHSEFNILIDKKEKDVSFLKDENKKITEEMKATNVEIMKFKHNAANAVIELNKSRNDFATKMNQSQRDFGIREQKLNNDIESYQQQAITLNDNIKNLKQDNFILLQNKDKLQDQIDEQVRIMQEKNNITIIAIIAENTIELNKCRKEYEETKNNLEILRNRNHALEDQLNTIETTNTSLEKNIKELEQSCANLERIRKTFEEKNNKLEREVDSLRIDNKEKAKDFADKDGKYRDKIEKENQKSELLENKNNQLNIANNKLTSELKSIEFELQQKLNENKLSFEKISMLYNKEKEQNTLLSNTVKQKEKELKNYSECKEQLNTLNETMETKISFYREEMEKLNRSKKETETSLIKTIQELENFKKEMDNRNDQFVVQLEKARLGPVEKQNELHRKEQELNKKEREYKEKLENMQKNPPTRIIDPSLKEARDKALANLRVQSIQLKELEKENKSLSERISDKERLLEEKHREKEMNVGVSQKQEKSLSDEIEKKNKRIAELETLLMSKVKN